MNRVGFRRMSERDGRIRGITYDAEGYPHGLTGTKLSKEQWEFSQTHALTGFDSDSGMTMLTALVHRTDRLRAAQREALRQAGHLFASLLHLAFQS